MPSTFAPVHPGIVYVVAFFNIVLVRQGYL